MDTMQNMILVLVASGFMGLIIGIFYKYTHSRAIYASQMTHALIVYSILTAMMLYFRITVSTAVLIGALSIIRFRNPIKDHRDLIYILWAIINGFCCATHMFEILGISSVLIVVVLSIFNASKKYDRVLLVVKSDNTGDEKVIDLLNNVLDNDDFKMLENNSIEENTTELIYEVRLKEEAFEYAEKIKNRIYDSISEISEVVVLYQEDDMAI